MMLARKNFKKSMLTISLVLLVSLTFVFSLCAQESQKEAFSSLDTPGKNIGVKRIKTITDNGGRVDWSPGGDLIAFDRKGEDSYYHVWTMNPDGSEQKCLTCDKNFLLKRHNGNPAWHPSGQYLLFQSEDPDLKILPISYKLLENVVTSPGAGINNNLWLMMSDGSQFWQLTHVNDGMGVLHPHFSHDGRKMVWAEKVGFTKTRPGKLGTWGEWAIKIADFVNRDQPQLENIKTYQPGNQHYFYETHGFSPDDDQIIFSGNLELDQHESAIDIYLLDMTSDDPVNLTHTLDEWDEHAQISPEGNKIVWVSSMDIKQKRDLKGNIKTSNLKLDFWLMDFDGSNKQRLTYFNDPTAPEYISGGAVAADSSFSPDGKRLAARMELSSFDKEVVIIIDLGE